MLVEESAVAACRSCPVPLDPGRNTRRCRSGRPGSPGSHRHRRTAPPRTPRDRARPESGRPPRRSRSARPCASSSTAAGWPASARWVRSEAEDVAEQVVRHVGQAWIVHREGRRQLLAHRLLEPAPQFDGHQRIHAEVEESGLLADLRRIDPGHLRDGVAQVVHDEFLALLHRSDGEPLDQLGGSRRLSAAGADSGTSRSNCARNDRLPASW